MVSVMKKFLSVLVTLVLVGLMAVNIAASEIKDADLVIMENNLVEITKEDLVRYIRLRIPQADRTRVLSKPDTLINLLQNIYVIRALAAQSNEAMKPTDLAQLRWESDFKESTRLSKITSDKVKKESLKGVDWDAYAREAYLGESVKFMTEEQVDVAHILLSTKVHDDEKALATITAVREKALAGEDFNVLAREYSDDPTAQKNGGELGVFAKGAMVKEFEVVAFALQKEGEISEITQTPFGYHLVRFNKRIPPKKQTFDEVKGGIIKSLKSRVQAKAKDALLTKTRSVNDVEINYTILEAIKAEIAHPVPTSVNN